MWLNELTAFYICLGILAIVLTICSVKLGLSANKSVVKWNLLTGITAIVLTFFCAESYYRFFVDRTDSFALTKIAMRWNERHFQKNNLGARDNQDYQLRKLKKSRITFLGDSFTAGHGIENVDKRFTNLLRNSFDETEIHIMAANGMESIDQLQLVKSLINQGYEFDIVCLAYCLNDISYAIPETDSVYNKVLAFNENLGWLSNESYLLNEIQFRLFAKTTPELKDYYSFVNGAYTSKVWSEQARTLQQIKLLCNSVGKEFVVVTLPFFHSKDALKGDENVNRVLNSFWKKEGVKHLNLAGAFSSYTPEELVVNRFDAHPNEEANRLIASKVETWLKSENILIPE